MKRIILLVLLLSIGLEKVVAENITWGGAKFTLAVTVNGPDFGEILRVGGIPATERIRELQYSEHCNVLQVTQKNSCPKAVDNFRIHVARPLDRLRLAARTIASKSMRVA